MFVTTPEIERDICESYAKGESFPSLEKRYDAFYTDINDVLTKRKVPHRKVGHLNKVLVGKENEIAEKYRKGMSKRDLAKLYQVDRSVINRILSEQGVTPRSSREANRKKVYDEQNVVDLFKSGRTMASIGAEIGLNLAAVHHCLIRNGAHVKRKNKGNRCQIPEEKFNEIIQLYTKENWSLCRILKHFGLKIGHSGLSKYLKQRGVTIRSGSIQNKQYFCDSTYFSNPHTPSKYWILGFIATDGYVNETKRFVNIEIGEKDIAVLEYIKGEMQYTGPISSNPKKCSVILNIRDNQIVTDLVNLGIHQNKSLTLKPMEWIRDDLFPHFLNGFISGDGWITCTYKKTGSSSSGYQQLMIGFCGASDLVPWIADKIKKRWNAYLSYNIHYGCHNYTTTRTETVLNICNDIFANAPFVLQRKHDAYLRFLAYRKSL